MPAVDAGTGTILLHPKHPSPCPGPTHLINSSGSPFSPTLRCWIPPLQGSHGWHVEVVPSEEVYCGTRQHCVVLTTHTIAACWSSNAHYGSQEGCCGSLSNSSSRSSSPQPALLWLMGHEVAHGLAQHTVRRCSMGGSCAGPVSTPALYLLADGKSSRGHTGRASQPANQR